MGYTRKPKDITQFLSSVHAQDTHTWQTGEGGGALTHSAGMSVADRRLREVRRTNVGSYQRSQIANIASSERQNIADHTRAQRQKISARMTTADDRQKYNTASLSREKDLPPAHTPPLYRRRPF